jgi:SAM-dependent methyltransferase
MVSMLVPLAYLDALRKEEFNRLMAIHEDIFKGKDVLEIGSGTGIQLRAVEKVARSAAGLELVGGAYVRDASLSIVEYDGLHIPFPDASFDVVFSSNVIEHISHQEQITSEIRRVLRSGGQAVHVVPTRAWRVLTSVLHYPRLVKSILFRVQARPEAIRRNEVRQNAGTRIKNILIPARHGDLGGWFAEYKYFGMSRWAEHFERLGWNVQAAEPMGLAYSGNCLFADRMPMKTRTQAAKIVGSSSAVFVLS